GGRRCGIEQRRIEDNRARVLAQLCQPKSALEREHAGRQSRDSLTVDPLEDPFRSPEGTDELHDSPNIAAERIAGLPFVCRARARLSRAIAARAFRHIENGNEPQPPELWRVEPFYRNLVVGRRCRVRSVEDEALPGMDISGHRIPLGEILELILELEVVCGKE